MKIQGGFAVWEHQVLLHGITSKASVVCCEIDAWIWGDGEKNQGRLQYKTVGRENSNWDSCHDGTETIGFPMCCGTSFVLKSGACWFPPYCSEMMGRILQPLLTCHSCQSVPFGESRTGLTLNNGILRGKELHKCLGDIKPQEIICAGLERTNCTTQARLFFDRITKLMDGWNEID